MLRIVDIKLSKRNSQNLRNLQTNGSINNSTDIFFTMYKVSQLSWHVSDVSKVD